MRAFASLLVLLVLIAQGTWAVAAERSAESALAALRRARAQLAAASGTRQQAAAWLAMQKAADQLMPLLPLAAPTDRCVDLTELEVV